MIRLFLDAPLTEGRTTGLSPEQAHYLARVMRQGVGDEVIAFNGPGGEWRCRIDALGKRGGTIVAVERMRAPDAGDGPWLAFALVKRAATDLIVEKGTELGVRRFLPIVARRSNAERVRVDRLVRIAVEAAEQSERIEIPAIDDPLPLARLVDVWPAQRRLLIAAERARALPLAEALSGIGESPWGLLVGPEGGFAEGELDGLLRLAFSAPVDLGPRVLRAETAALAGLAIGQAVGGDFRGDPSR